VSIRSRLSAVTPLRDCPESSVGLSFPLPISDRLDALVALAEASGERTNRKELVASLILAAPSQGPELARRVRRYRQASAGETLLAGQETAAVLTVARHRPGPRPRRQLPGN
jgi:hypothetical protein